MQFWRSAFMALAPWHTIALVGNHDRPGDRNSTAHSMMSHLDSDVTVVDRPMASGPLLFVPYGDAELVRFAKAADPDATLVCHATFQGAMYDNGFYAPDGLDPEALPQRQIISGHIHKPQEFGKVWYPGSPRWRTISDANQDRGYWLVEHGDKGEILNREFFSTGKVCRPIYLLEDTPESTAKVPESGDIVVDVRGPPDFVARRKRELDALGVRVRAFPVSERKKAVRESDGIGAAFGKYAAAWKPINGTDPEVLRGMWEKRIPWK